ncbi:MAG: DUF3943 domain-containing protein [Polyangia bacterium]
MRRILALALGMALTASSAAPAAAGEDWPRSETCEKSWTVPLVRMAVVDAAMLAGLTAIWPEGFAPWRGAGSASQMKRTWTEGPVYLRGSPAFESDGDPAWLNAALHPIYGSEMHLAARGWGHDPVVAALFAGLSSAFWEYAIEGWFKRPSAVDLFWTPLAGAILGELRFRAWSAVARNVSSPFCRGLLMVLLDPLGELERLALGCAPPGQKDIGGK